MNKYNVQLNRTENDPLNIMLDCIVPGSRVLEFGCANGRMTRYLKESLNCSVDIVEMDAELFALAQRYALRGICGDIQEYAWVGGFGDEKYDYIIFADVLEHLTEPGEVLQKCGQLLKDTGLLWISVPNLAHNDILINLLEDGFRYTETGLLDRTHIHFFTGSSAEEMIREAGYQILYRDGIFKGTGCSEQILPENAGIQEWYQMLTNRPRGEIYQYVFGVSGSGHHPHPLPENDSYFHLFKRGYERMGAG